MPKNIVICLDGTGNQIEDNLSNVLKLYRTLYKASHQVVYYDQGVGTFGQQHPWTPLSQKFKNVLGLATGYGLDTKVLNAYHFIIDHFEKGDKIYIFGFSRGAHMARVLAGVLYVIGLLKPEQKNLAGSALTVYKRALNAEGMRKAYHFRRITTTKTVSVEFLGVWDTVSSMITPRPDRFYIPSLEKLPNTKINPSVRVFRHAMAIDEFRRMFRLDTWEKEQAYKPNKHSQGERVGQDIKQVWFAGCHSDVGGGFKREESSMAQFPLAWLIEEAMQFGLRVNKRMLRHVAYGIKYNSQSQHNYPKPNHLSMLHNSMTLAWKWMEFLPKSVRRKEDKQKRSFFGMYLPLSEPRLIPKGANLHVSVVDRLLEDESYSPKHLPNEYKLVGRDK
jgi:uncharacterized protein (DUF2235 family)